MSKLIHTHPDRIVSVVLTRRDGARHMLRDGPTSGPGAKTLCGRSAEAPIDSADYCCYWSWAHKGFACGACIDVHWHTDREEWRARLHAAEDERAFFEQEQESPA